MYTYGSDEHRRGELYAKEGGLGRESDQLVEQLRATYFEIAVGGIAKHARDDLPALERL